MKGYLQVARHVKSTQNIVIMRDQSNFLLTYNDVQPQIIELLSTDDEVKYQCSVAYVEDGRREVCKPPPPWLL